MERTLLPRSAFVVAVIVLSSPVVLAKTNPNWPCAELVSAGDAPPTQTRRFTYQGPKTCRTLPDLTLVGCPTEEVMLEGAKEFRRRTFTYDAKGNLVKVEYHRDGKLTTRMTASWDASGIPVKAEVDNGLDGKIDVLNEYHRKGQAIVIESKQGGKVATIWIHHHDKAGKLLRISTDRFGDGKILLNTKWTYKGARPEKWETFGPSGKLLTRTIYQFVCQK